MKQKKVSQKEFDKIKKESAEWHKAHRNAINSADSNKLDLCNLDLCNLDLIGGDFSYADLNYMNFRGVNLGGADFKNSKLYNVDLRNTDLFFADFSGATICNTDLSYADLTDVNLMNTRIISGDISYAIFSNSMLFETLFNSVNCNKTNFSGSRFRETIITDCDLSSAIGLESITHYAKSTISISTIIKSKGKIPKLFMQGVGLPDSFIDFAKSFIENPIQYYSCFISYSSKDNEFAKRLHADLQKNGIRCWFAPEDLKIGDKTREEIEKTIRIRDKLLIILSKKSINSNWVETEVEACFEEESKHNKNILFPIMLDNNVMETDKSWAANIRRTRNIGDFTNWKDHDDEYQKAFNRLLRDLKAE